MSSFDDVVIILEKKGVVLEGDDNTKKALSLVKLAKSYFNRPIRIEDVCVYVEKILGRVVTDEFTRVFRDLLRGARKHHIIYALPVRPLEGKFGSYFFTLINKTDVFREIGLRPHHEFLVFDKEEGRVVLDYFRELFQKEVRKMQR